MRGNNRKIKNIFIYIENKKEGNIKWLQLSHEYYQVIGIQILVRLHTHTHTQTE